MRVSSKNLLGLMVLMLSAVSLAMGATITGTVKGPDGKPFEGAFVEAQNMNTTIMTDVLSQKDGSFKVPNLPAGDYRVSIRAVGYRSPAQNETVQTADQHIQCEFDLKKGAVSWSDISVYQAGVLLPKGTGKATWFRTCFGCHNFQSRMATRRLNYQGWMGLINYMRDDVVNYSLGPRGLPFPATNEMANKIASYLTQVFGLNSTLPASPDDLPGYQATVPKFSSEAMNIVYQVYPLADSTWLDFQAYPPTIQKGYYSDGYIWAADYGNGNRVVRVNPRTGKNTTYLSPQVIKGVKYPLPCKGEGIHAVEVGPQGNVWYAEQGCNRVGEVNLKTGKVTQFQGPFIDKSEWGVRGGYKHDSHPMMVNGKLYVFSSGDPATRLNPRTGKFTSIPGIPNTYDVWGDLVNGNVWFTGISPNTPLYEVNPRTLKTIIRYFPKTDPKNFKPHRITVGPKGTVWLTCYNSSRVCRFNPKTRAFKIYTPLGPNKHDYAIAIDHTGNIWYSMTFIDQIQRLNPKTGHMVQYPFPYPEITMRKFWRDAKGRIWTSSPANAVVVNWYLAGGKMLDPK